MTMDLVAELGPTHLATIDLKLPTSQTASVFQMQALRVVVIELLLQEMAILTTPICELGKCQFVFRHKQCIPNDD